MAQDDATVSVEPVCDKARAAVVTHLERDMDDLTDRRFLLGDVHCNLDRVRQRIHWQVVVTWSGRCCAAGDRALSRKAREITREQLGELGQRRSIHKAKFIELRDPNLRCVLVRWKCERGATSRKVEPVVATRLHVEEIGAAAIGSLALLTAAEVNVTDQSPWRNWVGLVVIDEHAGAASKFASAHVVDSASGLERDVQCCCVTGYVVDGLGGEDCAIWRTHLDAFATGAQLLNQEPTGLIGDRAAARAAPTNGPNDDLPATKQEVCALVILGVFAADILKHKPRDRATRRRRPDRDTSLLGLDASDQRTICNCLG